MKENVTNGTTSKIWEMGAPITSSPFFYLSFILYSSFNKRSSCDNIPHFQGKPEGCTRLMLMTWATDWLQYILLYERMELKVNLYLHQQTLLQLVYLSLPTFCLTSHFPIIALYTLLSSYD